MTIDLNGKKCSCGRRGCWEAYASEHALLLEATQLFDSNITLEKLIDLANHEDEQVILLFKQIGQYIGYGIANLANTMNPAQIIIGNRMSMAREWLKQPIEDAINQHALVFHQEDLQINFSNLSIYSSSLGVSAFVVENFFKEEQLNEHGKPE